MMAIVLVVFQAALRFDCFLFFQAEDGIRCFHVTGVQTCALPISTTGAYATETRTVSGRSDSASRRRWGSEERRVGKECRSRWSPYHEKTKSDPTTRVALAKFDLYDGHVRLLYELLH